MSQSREQPTDPGETRAARAEALLRSLTGILDARVELDPGGSISRVALLARHELAPRVAARNARSALLASLGLAIGTERISVDLERPGYDRPWRAAGQQPAPPAARNTTDRATADSAHGAAPPAPNGRPDDDVRRSANGTRPPARHRGNGALSAGAAPAGRPEATAHARPAPGLVRVDTVAAPDGHVRVRVVLALEDRISAGEAEGIDSPATRLELAARALLRALPVRDDRELEGIRTLDVGGRPYVVAVVRSLRGHAVQYHADAIGASGSFEHAAALATLGASVR